MRAMANQAPAEGAIPVSRVKNPEPKPFCGARDAKALQNYIFDLEQYFRATNTVTEEAKVTLATMYLSEDAKLWWSRGQRQSYMNKEFKTSRPRMLQPNGCLTCLTTLKIRDVIQVPHLEEVGTTAQVLLKLREGTDVLMEIVGPINRILETPGEDQTSLALDSDNQLSQTEREVDQTEEIDNPRMGALKFLSSLQKKVGETNTPVEMGLMYVDTWINQKPTKSTMVDSSATHNFITEVESKRLNLRWENDA
ncbi:senescence-specific cysteine protease sag39 [Cucumis melo var. makuwa]|uniref:Senescence-specific cysteine protease sag39 n=1 Tax=Cucumis melo var. makuwa TaxID=1194695 RepID=A0A5D3BCL8_CUCMM|nr:senescence-specific cysteine protease sag39 [Cucumis melo var. makuwa]TYJ96867.1 senescence-specific cysteine protease sag39 [Cucumis melo var. makuwa]